MGSTNQSDNRKPPIRWLRFGIGGLLLLTLLVATYLAGFITQSAIRRPDFSGAWTARLPGGAEQPTTLESLGDGRWLVRSRASVFNGVYAYDEERLTIVQPDDARMTGLVWGWDGKQLVLIEEPRGKPTGATYLGTVLAEAEDPGTGN